MKPFFRNYSLILIFAIQLIVYRVLGSQEYFVTEIYLPFYIKFQSFYILVFNHFPFSVGDIFYIISIGFLLFSIVKIGISLYRKKFTDAKLYFTKILRFFSILIFLFYWFFGFLYADNQLKKQLEANDISVDELKVLAQYYLIKTKQLSQENQNELIEENVQQSLNNSVLTFNDSIIRLKTHPEVMVKKSMFSNAISYLGIAGYYNPFTYEAHYNCNIPTHNLPFTLAHEKAHQLGYASESEANFIGFMLCKKSNSISTQYSANFMALKYLLSEIYSYDSIYVKKVINNYSTEMQKNRWEEKLYFNRYQGRISSAFSSMNDLYLKLNHQEGIKSYNNFVKLLVAYHRKRVLPYGKTPKNENSS